MSDTTITLLQEMLDKRADKVFDAEIIQIINRFEQEVLNLTGVCITAASSVPQSVQPVAAILLGLKHGHREVFVNGGAKLNMQQALNDLRMLHRKKRVESFIQSVEAAQALIGDRV